MRNLSHSLVLSLSRSLSFPPLSFSFSPSSLSLKKTQSLCSQSHYKPRTTTCWSPAPWITALLIQLRRTNASRNSSASSNNVAEGEMFPSIQLLTPQDREICPSIGPRKGLIQSNRVGHLGQVPPSGQVQTSSISVSWVCSFAAEVFLCLQLCSFFIAAAAAAAATIQPSPTPLAALSFPPSLLWGLCSPAEPRPALWSSWKAHSRDSKHTW